MTVGQVTETNPIINHPYQAPTHHWFFGGDIPKKHKGRRRAGYLPPAPAGEGEVRITDDLIDLPVVNDIRQRVDAWRDAGYPGATNVTQNLFEFWFDDERIGHGTRPFFAQQEAIETISFLTEASPDLRLGLDIPGFEAYQRWAIKMATGTGKTLAMAMTITWCGLNKEANRKDWRFADAVLVVCPNLTVLTRLTSREGLLPSQPDSAYQIYDLVPANYSELLGQIKVQVINWHKLAPLEDPPSGVVQRGAESDAAFARRVLNQLDRTGRLLVLNDEAHHAWRLPTYTTKAAKGLDDAEAEAATVWIDGLARIHRARTVQICVDYSATPMYPGLAGAKAWTPFEWLVTRLRPSRRD